MLAEMLLLIILLWDGYFFLNYLLSLRTPVKTSDWRPKVSVIIPAYNEENKVLQSLKAALNQDYGEVEVILVDDGSEDKTYEVAASISHPRLKAIRIEHSGKAKALNAGLSVSSGDVIVTTDADGTLEKSAVRELVKRFHSGEVVAVGGQVRIRGRDFLSMAQDVEHLRIAMFRRGKELEDLSLAPGPISAFKRDALERIGGFVDDPVEDYATTVALKKFGKVVYAPSARVWVKMPSDIGSLWRQRKRWFLGDLGKLGGGPLKERLFLLIGDLVALADVLFPLLSIFGGKLGLLLIFLSFEIFTALLSTKVEGGSLYGALMFPLILWFWAGFYLLLHIYGYFNYFIKRLR